MKRIITGITFVVLTTMVLSGFIGCKTSSSTSASRVLKFNLEKGRQYDYEMVWDMNQKAMGQENAFSIGAFYTIDVTENEGNIRTMIGTYKKFSMTMNIMGMQIDIDTDKLRNLKSTDSAGKNPMVMMKKLFSSIVDKSFTMKVNDEGKVLEVSGFKEMIAGMLDSLDLDEEEKIQGLATLNDQFNDESVRDQFAQLFYIFPNKEVKVGDSWEKSHAAGGKMPAKYTTAYKVKEIEGDFVTLDAKSKIETNGDLDLNGSQTGTLIVDSRSGLVVNAKFDQSISISVQGVSLEMTGKGNIKGTEKN